LIIMHSVLVGARELTRGSQTFFGVPREIGFGEAVAAAVVFILIALAWKESRPGLMLRAVRDSEPAARAVGIDPWRARLGGFAVSGALATVSGALYGHMLGAFSPRDFYFAITFAMVAMLIVGGLMTVTGAVVGTITITLLQDTVRQFENGFMVAGFEVPAIFGLTTGAVGVAILLVIYFRPEGLFGKRELSFRPLSWALSKLLPAVPPPAAAPAAPTDAPQLVTHNLTRKFDGLTAVDNVSLTVLPGRITGLIGPNGAGKSTLVNLLSGHIAPTSGDIEFGDVALAGRSAEAIARAGLARTFQNNRLFDQLTVRENIAVAAIGMGLTRREAAARAEREILAMNLTADAERLAGTLPYGARKRLDIARCLAGEPKLLLLDEPAAGMNPDETADLGNRIAAIADVRGIAVVLIDHDLEFVNRLSSEIVVMNRGAILARGTPADIRKNPDVIEAYIGTGETDVPSLSTIGVSA
ncbi:MAG: branched-chain amino acid ABC transporter ATP-binding protein/permease, partial [Pseudomonadota bacterium]